MEITRDCKTFKKDRKYFTFSLSKEEEEFPLAYTMVIHNKIEMFERLLRSIYMPHNVYCVHIDEKSKAKFKEAVKSITMCFDNVFVASKLETVVYASWSRVQADLNCMEDMLESTVQWKYLLNTCGTDFPIKTNHEIVIALKSLNGKNSMESEKTPAQKMGRWLYHHDVDKRVLRTTEKKSAPPDNIPMFSGNAYVVITKDFVKALFNNSKVKKVLEWEKDTFSPDEHLWATLHRMPEVPGSVPSHSKYDTSDLQAIARLVKWLDAAGDLSKGAPYENCNGIFARGVCVYGIGDLPWMLQQHHLFANKFDTLVDNYAIECLEQYVRHKTLYGTNL
ncbi:beta-1,3-galactosyl-O-glycosyl-glycoprotein beta-1,6-N-acetylglucosaminyltransferase 3-like [Hyperolius riggenbachi]|uniref:beta-1,3-galactosyl-O-glycosyl-glycoprotein beta-1,6-N-acetylglucosaminyltransferase 3-like n=1 Tax=Hyperolius riggenbachi TaxID=752182 RepID=UPI0035A3D1D0